MATVPLAGNKAPTELRPLNPQYQSVSGVDSSAFGGTEAAGLQSAGRDLTRAGDRLGDIALKNQIDDNQREVKDLDVQLTTQYRLLMSGDGTEQNPGYKNLKGQHALDAYPTTAKSLEEIRQNILKSASNDRVRQDFDEWSATRREQELANATDHSTSERLVANDATSEARKGEAIADVFSDPSKLPEALATVNGENFAWLKAHGYENNADVVKAKMREGQTLVYGNAIQGMLENDPEGAQKLFDQYKSQMDPAVAEKLGRVLLESTIDARAQRAAEDAYVRAGGNYTKAIQIVRDESEGKQEVANVEELKRRQAEAEHAVDRAYTLSQRDQTEENRKAVEDSYALSENYIGMTDTWEEAIAMANEADIPVKTKDAVIQRINQRREIAAGIASQQRAEDAATIAKLSKQEAEEIKAKNAAGNSASNDLIAYIRDGGDRMGWIRANPDPYNAILDMPNGMGNSKLLAAEQLEKNMIEGEPFRNASDNKTFIDIKRLDTKDRAEINLEALMPYLTRREYEQAVALQLADKKQIENARTDPGQQTALLKAIRSVIPVDRVGGKKVDRLTQDQVNEVNADMLTWWDDNFASAGKKPTEQEMRAKATELMLDLVKPGDLWGYNPTGLVMSQADTLDDEQRSKMVVANYGMKLSTYDGISAIFEKAQPGTAPKVIQQMRQNLARAGYLNGDLVDEIWLTYARALEAGDKAAKAGDKAGLAAANEAIAKLLGTK